MKDNKQTVQFIILGVLVAVCVGVVTVMLLPKKQSGPPPAQAKAPDASAPASEAPTTDASLPIGAGPSAQGGVAEEIASAKVGQGRDPFSPAMDMSVHLAQNPITAAAKPGSTRPAKWQMASVPQVGPWTEPGARIGTGSGGKLPVTPDVPGGEATKPQAAQPEVKPAFVLTGVITGGTNVAIIRLNENRYIVREGQMIDGKYLVVKVTGHNVMLARGGQDIVLELGG